MDAATVHHCAVHGIRSLRWQGPRDFGVVKFQAIQQLLREGTDVLFSELDVFWFQNAVPLFLASDALQVSLLSPLSTVRATFILTMLPCKVANGCVSLVYYR
jgi:hypothetical protein